MFKFKVNVLNHSCGADMLISHINEALVSVSKDVLEIIVLKRAQHCDLLGLSRLLLARTGVDTG